MTIANPLDYHTFIWGDGPRTTDVFTTMLAGYDAGMYIIDPPRKDRCDPSGYQPALDAIVAAQKATGVPAFPVASFPENFDEGYAIQLMDQGVCTMMGLETALAAIKAAQVGAGPRGWRPVAALPERESRLLSEAEGKALLQGLGVVVPHSVSGTWDQVVAGAVELIAPYALKGLGFAHKTELGCGSAWVEQPCGAGRNAGGHGLSCGRDGDRNGGGKSCLGCGAIRFMGSA